METDNEPDLISELPISIIETILTKLPIRDAVKTSILSTKWRYKWASLTHLVFDDRSSTICNDRVLIQDKIVNFITRCLFLHEGPIHKFSLCSSYLQSSPDIDQWLLFISRKAVKELILELGEGEWFRAPSSIFSCKNLTRLELVRCELDPPFNFGGFSCLKYLNLQQVLIPPDDIECLISRCPLLESLTLSYFDSLELTVRAPNLKYLILEGEFKDLCLASAPRLVAISVAMYMTDDIFEHFEQNSSCNFDKLLGGVPKLERLIGHIYFTKYLSIGNSHKCSLITFHDLKFIELYQVGFDDVKEILIVLQLIVNSPNLEALQISNYIPNACQSSRPYVRYIQLRAILTPTLDVVDAVNQYMIDNMSGQCRNYFNSDTACNTDSSADIIAEVHTPKFLNSINCSGVPNQELNLKVGMPVMLLRNLDPGQGLCNGTRLSITRLGQHFIEGKIITGTNAGENVLIPRLFLTPSDIRVPFKFQRRQFPIMISYAMTINKSHGQSLSKVGLFLKKSIFSHGQLYVAVSRFTNPRGLKILLCSDENEHNNQTVNVVYKEIFQNLQL